VTTKATCEPSGESWGSEAVRRRVRSVGPMPRGTLGSDGAGREADAKEAVSGDQGGELLFGQTF
jgi:hypothetical protein